MGTDLYLGGKGEVAVFMKKISVQSNNLRRKGFTNALARRYPGVRIVEVNEDNEDIEANYRMTKDLIKKYPNLSGVYITIGNTLWGRPGPWKKPQNRPSPPWVPRWRS